MTGASLKVHLLRLLKIKSWTAPSHYRFDSINLVCHVIQVLTAIQIGSRCGSLDFRFLRPWALSRLDRSHKITPVKKTGLLSLSLHMISKAYIDYWRKKPLFQMRNLNSLQPFINLPVVGNNDQVIKTQTQFLLSYELGSSTAISICCQITASNPNPRYR